MVVRGRPADRRHRRLRHGARAAGGSERRRLERAAELLAEGRPTAVNLRWALDRMRDAAAAAAGRRDRAPTPRRPICDEDVAIYAAIGDTALTLIEASRGPQRGEPVNVLTHCNAGWLATVDWGTALAPVYKAHGAGIRCMSGSTRRARATRAPA